MPDTADTPAARPRPARPPSSSRAFGVLWGGQLVSLLGSSAAAFCLALTVYTETGDASALALIVGASTLGSIYLAPVAGAVSDHFTRRQVVCVGNVTLSLLSLLLAWQVWRFTDEGDAEYWTILLLVFLAGVVKAALSTTLAATVRQLRAERDLSRVNGFTSLIETIPTVSGPVIGAALHTVVTPAAVFAFEAVTFAAAGAMAAAVRWPSVGRESGRNRRLRPFAGALRGFRFILGHSGFRRLQAAYAGVNLFAGLATAVVTVYVVSSSTAGTEERNLAAFTVAGPVGLLLGAIAMLTLGDRGSRFAAVVTAIAAGALLGRLGLALTAVPLLWFLAQLLNQACVQISNAHATAVWQERTPTDIQATVFGARRLLGQGLFPPAVVLGGFLADRGFQDHGRLAEAAGTLVPRLAEDGGGAGLLLACCALGQAALALLLACSARVRRLTARPRPAPQSPASPTAASEPCHASDPAVPSRRPTTGPAS
ncbi:MFS transporter [Streptomyces lonarensis]|uniref:MFS transporter n=1 Tax=Streptomyces lonarensis TaxID=700599 RepID=A0A7X6HYH9_9ACTN|nr:MFS transporter [Streptomyces lonarensis]NJQ05430.1 MFS transporter [Streptomyces lonarensis]